MQNIIGKLVRHIDDFPKKNVMLGIWHRSMQIKIYSQILSILSPLKFQKEILKLIM